MVEIVNENSAAVRTTLLEVRSDATNITENFVKYDFNGTGTTAIGFYIDSEMDR